MWKLIRHLIKSYEHKTLILCLMFWLSVANVAVPVMFGNLVELLQGGNTGALTMLRSPWMVLAVLAICSLFQWVAGYWVAVLRLKSGTILESRLRKTAWSHLNGVGLAEMYMRPPGEWVQRICGDTALVGGAFQSVVFSIWGFGTFFALTGMAVCRKVPMATAVLATSVFMAVSLHFIFRKRLSRRAMYLRKGSYHFNSFAYDMILMQPMLRMFKAIPVFTSMFCSKSDRFAMRRIGCEAYSIKYNAALQFEVLFWDVVVLCGCVGLFGCGKIGVAELISYHLLTTQLVGGVGGIMQSMPQIIQGYETAKTIAPMFDTPSCSQNKREQHESEVEAAAENAGEAKPAASGENAEAGKNAETVSENRGDDQEMAEEIPEVRELTEKELKKLQWSIRGSDNGFFVSTYYRPEEIDWQQVFYNGAGVMLTLSDDQVAIIRERLREERLIEEQRRAELLGVEPVEDEEDAEPAEPPFTEEELALNAGQITALTLRSIQNFVKSRTGLDYSEARKPLEWPELTKNVFYFVHNDSNAMRIELMSGTVCGNLYELTYRKAVWSREKKPEFVMQVKIENGKWNFISNLPIDEAKPKTLADVEFFTSKELARMQGVKELFDFPETPEEEDFFAEDLGLKAQAKEPTYFWAVITATEDDSVVFADRVYRGDEISKELSEKHYYVPGENLATVALNAGEKIGIKVSLEDAPKLRVRVRSGNFEGSYVFGSENRLKRVTKEGLPLSTYVYGRDYDGERRGTAFTSEAELLRFLEGTWVFYDSEMGEYTATLTFDLKGNVLIHTIGDEYVLSIVGYDRLYTDARSDPPDLIKLKSIDADTLELFTKYYPTLVRKVGDYRIRALQKDGEQLLLLSIENNVKDGLSQLLPGANPLADEIILYRFIGTEGSENN